MKSINLRARQTREAERNAEFLENADRNLKVSREVWLEKKGAAARYLTEQHTYVLLENSQPTELTLSMSGEEAKLQNEVFQQKFREALVKAIDEGKPYGQTGAVLRRWKLVPPEPQAS